jgi:MarR family transcriptional regulator, 2-MHQ and catechol-resistance regulon repressor
MRTTLPDPGSAARVSALESVIADIGRTAGTLRCAGSQRLVELGISMTHFHVLTLLRHHEAMPMGRLAEILDASMSNVTGIIDRMEERGLVERTRVPDDRRVVLVSLTATGIDLVDQAELVRSDILAAAMTRLDAGQLDRMESALSDLRAALAEELAAAPGRYPALADCGHSHGHHGPHAHQGAPDIHRHSATEGGLPAHVPGTAGA